MSVQVGQYPCIYIHCLRNGIEFIGVIVIRESIDKVPCLKPVSVFAKTTPWLVPRMLTLVEDTGFRHVRDVSP
jgi:hypothetical protein